MNAQMRARRRRGVELVPEFRRLIAHVPSAFGAARREHALLGAGGFLVAADAGDQAVEAIFGQRHLQPFGLARRRARGRRQGRVDGLERRAGLDLQIELPFLAVAVAERIHLRKFLAGVDMQRRERHPAEERLARQPDHHVGILAERPQQRQLLQPRESFAENVDALGLELVEMIHGQGCRRYRGSASGRYCGTEIIRRPSDATGHGWIVVEKMHLWPWPSEAKNSIVALQ